MADFFVHGKDHGHVHLLVSFSRDGWESGELWGGVGCGGLAVCSRGSLGCFFHLGYGCFPEGTFESEGAVVSLAVDAFLDGWCWAVFPDMSLFGALRAYLVLSWLSALAGDVVVKLVASEASFDGDVLFLFDLVWRDAGVEQQYSKFLSSDGGGCTAECDLHRVAVWELEDRINAVLAVLVVVFNLLNYFFWGVVVGVFIHAEEEHSSLGF